jgi:DNA-binding transcriptional LysR family regulator
MEMYQVRCFVAVARYLNFTKAAESLRVAQPSLSRAIQKLEEELGGQLIHRERSFTHLTELGRTLHPHLEVACTAIETTKRQARDFHSRSGGRLVLGACALIETETLGPLLDLIQRRSDNIEFQVVAASSDAVRDGLLSGQFDAGFITDLPGSTPSSERLALQILIRDTFVVAHPPGHRFAALPEVTLEMLDGEPLAEHSANPCEQALAGIMEARGCTRLVKHRANDIRWLVWLVRAGLACAILPEMVACRADLDRKPLNGVDLWPSIAFATIAGRRHSPALAKLVRQVANLRIGIEGLRCPRPALATSSVGVP